MFSGKTTELMRLCKRYELARKKVLKIKPKIDQRYDNKNKISTHDLNKTSAIECIQLKEINVKEYDIVAIDEGHFFSDVISACKEWESNGKHVIITTLNGDSNQNPFKNISNLIPYASKITHLTAICSNCGNDAPFSIKIIDNDSQIQVGGIELYKPVCGTCLYK